MKGFGMSRRQLSDQITSRPRGAEVLAMAAFGTKPTSRHVCADVRFRWEDRKSYIRAELFRF
jgi:hypothetical protein